MTGPRSAEERISLWLEEEAVGFLPDRVLETTFDRTRDLRQASRSGWRPFSMSRPIPALIAVGAAAIVITAGVIYLRPAPRDQIGGGSPSIEFTSPQYGYVVDIPSTWDVVPAAAPWPAGQRIETDPGPIDTFQIPGSPIGASVRIAAQPVPDGTTSTSWLTEWEGIREDIGGHCFGSSPGWVAATVAGHAAWEVKWRCEGAVDERAAYDEYTFLVDRNGYVVTGTPSMVDLMLETFRVPGAVASGSPIDTSDWTTYRSRQYGFEIGHPSDWTEIAATRAWDPTADSALDPLSPALDSFSTPDGDVRVSVWIVPQDPGPEISNWEDLEAWAEEFCRTTGNSPCENIQQRATPMCLERRDCHPALIVPFDEDVEAFFIGGGAPLTVVAVWRPESDPSVDRFGGSRRLLEAFLSTREVFPPTGPDNHP